MDPISFGIELELGALLLAGVGAICTWLHHRHQKAHRQQRERHHREQRAMQERHHRERLAALPAQERPLSGLER